MSFPTRGTRDRESRAAATKYWIPACAGMTMRRASRTFGMINDLWYKNAIIYCLSVGTYMDANGDGIGDFQGLMRRLDYLHGLGVTAIWLMPFQNSPGRDDG